MRRPGKAVAEAGTVLHTYTHAQLMKDACYCSTSKVDGTAINPNSTELLQNQYTTIIHLCMIVVYNLTRAAVVRYSYSRNSNNFLQKYIVRM